MSEADQFIAQITALQPDTRVRIATILDEAAAVIPSADAAVRACATRSEASIAHELQEDSMVLTRLVGRVKELHMPLTAERYLVGLLDYHRELAGQAGLFAFGQATEGNRAQRAGLANGFGAPASKLIHLRDAVHRLVNG